ncbi:hypothetical protein M431DRAFT_514248, partial [Trichoderma harzianum CBS 226.95]
MDFELSSAQLSHFIYMESLLLADARRKPSYTRLGCCIRGIMCFLLFLSAGCWLGATLYGKFYFYFYVKL